MTNADEQKLTPYLAGLIALLCVCTFSEGYDFFIMSLVLEKLGGEFHVKIGKMFQVVVALVNCGAVAGFFVARLGDRFGRKPILLLGLIGFSGLSLVTATSASIYHYVAAQFFAKMFLVTEFGMAILIVSEEFPPRRRATFVAILQVAGALGGGAAMFTSGMILPHWGWRGMYWLGGAPLVLAPALWLYVRETRHFRELNRDPRAAGRSLAHIWRTPSRKYVALVGLLWFLAYLCYAGVIYAWPTFAKLERGLTVKAVSGPLMIASLMGMLGYLVCGVMMDLVGRRVTSMAFFLGSGAALIWAFTAHPPFMIPAIVACMFFAFALLPVCSTYNAELFPTEMRADAAAWGNYLMGRPAQVVAPFLIGSLKGVMGGIGAAVCMLAAGPFLAVLVVLFFLPETKGVKLDRV